MLNIFILITFIITLLINNYNNFLMTKVTVPWYFCFSTRKLAGAVVIEVERGEVSGRRFGKLEPL